MTTTTRDTLIAQRVLLRDLPDRSRIVATLRIHHLSGNAHPYFSATCDVYDAHGTHSGAARHRNGREMDSAGASHGLILDAFPGAAAFVRMHLSDYPSGVPMHAEANAWHFLSGDADRYDREHYSALYVARRGDGPTVAARILRLETPDALPYDVLRAAVDGTLTDDHRAAFATFVAEQGPRWKREARAAHDLLSMMPDACDLRGYDMAGKPIERLPLPSWLTGSEPEMVNV